jgi:hypothetical protein
MGGTTGEYLKAVATAGRGLNSPNEYLRSVATAGRSLNAQQPSMISPQYDSYTAARRPSYTPFGPSGQFYQPIYQPSYSDLYAQGNEQAPFGGFYQPQMPTFSRPMMPSMQQSYSIPYRTMGQVKAAQAAAAPPPSSSDVGGFKQGGQVDDGIASLLKR